MITSLGEGRPSVYPVVRRVLLTVELLLIGLLPRYFDRINVQKILKGGLL